MKILIGGSPCTHWSIAQTKNRETEASGIGWELFLNYRIARDKYQPDFFLYENNKSMSPAIRAQITAELGVEPVLINSALVSAQNRQRLYWVGRRNPDGTYSQVAVEQPVDRGILLRDILESGVCWKEKGYALLSTYGTKPTVCRRASGIAAPRATNIFFYFPNRNAIISTRRRSANPLHQPRATPGRSAAAVPTPAGGHMTTAPRWSARATGTEKTRQAAGTSGTCGP